MRANRIWVLAIAGIGLLAWAHPGWAQVVAMEYFLDEDPGTGQGVAVSVEAGAVVDADFTVDLTAADPGLHVLYVRVRDVDGVWSLSTSQSVLVEAVTTHDAATELSGVEYFLNLDPGPGAGTSVAEGELQPAVVSIATQFTVALDHLPGGLHTLFVRARDAQGEWGLATAKPILVETVTVLDGAPDVAGLEYFLDEDPGFGGGAAIAPELGALAAALFVADLSEVEHGLHTLFVRPRDARGQWGIGVARPILVQPGSAAHDPAPALAEAEFFIDEDPGFGAATDLGGQALSGASIAIAQEDVEPGLHTLHLRVRDERGIWSIPTSKPLFLDDAAAADAAPEIVSIDHFLVTPDGSDRGPDRAYSAFPSADTVTLDFDVALDSSAGDQILVLAARDSRGIAGLPISHPVTVEATGGGPPGDVEPDPIASDGTATLDFALVPGDQGVRRLTGVQPGQEIAVRLVLQREFTDFQQVAVTVVFDPTKMVPSTSRTVGLFSGAFTLDPIVQNDRADFGGALLVGEPLSGRGEVLELGFGLSESFSGSTLLELVEFSIGPSLEQLQTFSPGAAVVVTTRATIPGDFNGDRQVDFADLFIFANGFGSAAPAFDLDGSGSVDLGDFFVFADNFGRTA